MLGGMAGVIGKEEVCRRPYMCMCFLPCLAQVGPHTKADKAVEAVRAQVI